MLMLLLRSECERTCRCSVSVWQRNDCTFTHPFSNIQPAFLAGAHLSSTMNNHDSLCVRLKHGLTKMLSTRYMTLSQFQVRLGHPGKNSKHDSCWLILLFSHCLQRFWATSTVQINVTLFDFFSMYFGRFVTNWSCLISSQSHCFKFKQQCAEDNQCPKTEFYWKILLVLLFNDIVHIELVF